MICAYHLRWDTERLRAQVDGDPTINARQNNDVTCTQHSVNWQQAIDARKLQSIIGQSVNNVFKILAGSQFRLTDVPNKNDNGKY